MKLGRRPARRSALVPALARYKRRVALPKPPSEVLPPDLDFPMHMNDRIGDCVIAAIANYIQIVTGRIMTDDEVRAFYHRVGGYDPSDPSTDQGCVVLDALQIWMQEGFAGHKLDGFCAMNISDLDELKDCCNWFGGCLLGVNLPRSAEQNTNLWDVVPGSPLAGGHCVLGLGYRDSTNLAYALSWTKVIPTTPAFIGCNLEEGYALLSKDRARSDVPQLDWSRLQADMQLLRQMPAVRT